MLAVTQSTTKKDFESIRKRDKLLAVSQQRSIWTMTSHCFIFKLKRPSPVPAPFFSSTKCISIWFLKGKISRFSSPFSSDIQKRMDGIDILAGCHATMFLFPSALSLAPWCQAAIADYIFLFPFRTPHAVHLPLLVSSLPDPSSTRRPVSSIIYFFFSFFLFPSTRVARKEPDLIR